MPIKFVRNFIPSYAGFWFGIQRYGTLGVTYVGLGPVVLSIGKNAEAPAAEWGDPAPQRPARVLAPFDPEVPVGEYLLPLTIFRMSLEEYAAMVLERDGVGA